MTQRDTVLRMLRDAGSRGVHTFELRGAFIGNPSQRIAELEDAGYAISHTRERLHGKAIGTRYRLATTTSGPPSAASPVPPQADEGGIGALFQIGRAQQSAIYDADYGDAA